MTLFSSKHPVISPEQRGSVEVASRDELSRCPHWACAFASKRKDYRYYEIVEETILQGFDYRYFAIKDEQGEVRAVQPFFIHDQDLLEGVGPRGRSVVAFIRRAWPRFLRMRALMVGCAAGEGHLAGESIGARLAEELPRLAQASNASLV